MNKRMNICGVSFLGLLPALLVPQPAVAQAAAGNTEEAQPAKVDPRSGGIEEIVVTAQRREQSSRDVAIAITSVSGDQLASRGVTSSVERSGSVCLNSL
jgi:iron complex outermembrane receptor protein